MEDDENFIRTGVRFYICWRWQLENMENLCTYFSNLFLFWSYNLILADI